MKVCHCCGKQFEDHLVLVCSVCKNNFGNVCMGMNSSEVRIVNSRKSITWCCKGCEAVGNDLTSLRSVIVSLQEEIRNLKAAMDTIQASSAVGLGEDDIEEIISEFEDRQRRKNNVVIFGLSEQPHNLARDVRESRDSKSAVDLINVLDKERNWAVGDVKIVRIGNGGADASKPRPVKVVFQNHIDPRRVLRGTKFLKGKAEYSGIFVNSDRTPRQLRYYNGLKQEVMRRTANGEALRIKYIQGVPKIQNLN